MFCTPTIVRKQNGMTNKSRAEVVAAIMVFFIAGPGFTEESTTGAFSMEPLRDPFWPVGYFPENWQTESSEEEMHSVTSGPDWNAPASQISVSATSRMGDKAVAIINGDLKEEGDFIEISYGGRIYQWKLKTIHSSGKVDIERVGISNAGIGFHPGDKK